ncbi:hypothetical protein HF086_012891 [Spodoptera exigua]|uniref:SCP domain-containing protein n=1 Tax=Spodoptera exigua TaxID=7107 RepID=A0A922MUZ0_SPOEX|nr:hypothetical protein HF086_012891 [Spodoptera exigua]
MLGVVVVLSGVLALAAASSVNYCGARMCGNTNAHTFCQYPEGPSPKCLGYVEAKLSIKEKARLLDRLNSRRNVAAIGGMRGFPAAGNMLKLRWVEELAREAQRWADQCRPPQPVEEHDTCRNLYSLTVGQCVASVVGESPGLQVESMVDIWYIQSMLYKGNVSNYVPPTNDSRYYGDFAQIIWANSYMVGCARSRFMTLWQGRLRSVERLVCNIAPFGPQPTRPLWTPAAPTTACPYRSVRSSVWSGLCDYQRKQNEIVALDPSTTLEEHILLNTILEIEENGTLNYFGSIDEIYITKLAIATLANTLTTKARSNSKQRREVIDFVDLIEFHFNDSTIAFVPQVLFTQDYRLLQNIQLSNTTVPLQSEMIVNTATTPQIENRSSSIGINSTINKKYSTTIDEKTENVKAITEIPKKERNNHSDYTIITSNYTTSKDLLRATEGPNATNVQKVSNSTSISEHSNTTGVSEASSTTDDYEYHTFTAVHPKLLEDVTKFQFPKSTKNSDGDDQDDYDESDERSGSGSGDEEDSDDDEESGDGNSSGDGKSSSDGKSGGGGKGSGNERSSSGDEKSSIDGISSGDGNSRIDKKSSGDGISSDYEEGSADGEAVDVRKNYYRLGEMPNKTEDLYNYDSGPETIRQLQEALNSIEYNMEPKSEKQRKVRRELHRNRKEDGRLRKYWRRSRDEEEIPGKVAESVKPFLTFMKIIPGSERTRNRSIASCVAPSLLLVIFVVFIV